MRDAKITVETDAKLLNQYLDEMIEIAHAEIKNAKESIQYLEKDSRLGWEPTMEYIGTIDRVEWKEKMMNYVLNFEIATYKKCVAHDLK